MEGAEAEAILDSGRERCVELILRLAGAGDGADSAVGERVWRLEAQTPCGRAREPLQVAFVADPP
jgi:hypothetical protein